MQIGSRNRWPGLDFTISKLCYQALLLLSKAAYMPMCDEYVAT